MIELTIIDFNALQDKELQELQTYIITLDNSLIRDINKELSTLAGRSVKLGYFPSVDDPSRSIKYGRFVYLSENMRIDQLRMMLEQGHGFGFVTAR